MLKMMLLLVGAGLLAGFGVASAQSTNPTGAVGLGPTSGQTAPTGAPAGAPFITQRGPAVNLGGNGPAQTLVMPGGGTGVARPNGNGTSTITRPNGSVEVINTPR
jgi:hypothetical protein